MLEKRAGVLTFAIATVVAAFGCAPDGSSTGVSTDDVTSVENTDVREQAIGNCWLYATAGWAESLHKGVAGEDVDLSEAYWTYWYWYEQLTGGDIGYLGDDGVDNEGQWVYGAELIRRYGWMIETDFLPDADAKAKRHEEAVAYIDESLRRGALAGTNGAADPALARAELNRAWHLRDEVVADLERAFAPGSQRWTPLADRAGSGGFEATFVRAPQAFSTLGADGRTVVNLADVVGRAAPGTRLDEGQRVGPHAWSSVGYTWRSGKKGEPRRAAILKNVQDVLNRRLAVPISWLVTETADRGVYRRGDLRPQDVVGVHVSLLVDYEVEGVPGFGTLPVGRRETRPEALEASLSDGARVTFFRMKNSWGKDPELLPGRTQPSHPATYLPSAPGYNDIYVDYLDNELVDPKRFGQWLTLPPVLRFPIPN